MMPPELNPDLLTGGLTGGDAGPVQAAAARIAGLETELAELRRATSAKSQELQRLAADAIRLRELAEEANRSKSEFLSNMSHELRTPLTAMLGFAELIRDEPKSADVPGFAERIRENGHQLLSLIDDILDLARVEAGNDEVVPESFSPRALLISIVESFRPQAAARGLSLEVFIGHDVPESVESDPGKFRQILWNLLSNGLKFTQTGGVLARLLVDPLPDPPQLQVDIVDTGIGIPADKLPTLFQPFTQVNASLSRSYGGTGLGLVLCQRYCEMLGGTIEVSSLPGRGTNFTFWVSFRNASPAPATSSSATMTQLPGRAIEGCRILIVEDTPANLYLLIRMMQRAGAKTFDAANGLLGVEAVQKAQDEMEAIDAILMDMQMPVMDGYQATQEIRRLGYTGPIVAVTADKTDHARVRSLSAGCDGYLAKPVDRRELIHLLQRLMLLQRHRESMLDQPLMWE